MRDVVNELPSFMILMRDFITYNLFWGKEKTSTRRNVLEQTLDKFDSLCFIKLL